MAERLRPTERLKCSGEYDELFRRGRCFRTPFFRIHYLPRGRELSRLGLVVGRKLGNAVERNRLKRVLREVFRKGKGLLPEPMDVVFVPQVAPRESRVYVEAFFLFAERVRNAPGR